MRTSFAVAVGCAAACWLPERLVLWKLMFKRGYCGENEIPYAIHRVGMLKHTRVSKDTCNIWSELGTLAEGVFNLNFSSHNDSLFYSSMELKI